MAWWSQATRVSGPSMGPGDPWEAGALAVRGAATRHGHRAASLSPRRRTSAQRERAMHWHEELGQNQVEDTCGRT